MFVLTHSLCNIEAKDNFNEFFAILRILVHSWMNLFTYFYLLQFHSNIVKIFCYTFILKSVFSYITKYYVTKWNTLNSYNLLWLSGIIDCVPMWSTIYHRLQIILKYKQKIVLTFSGQIYFTQLFIFFKCILWVCELIVWRMSYVIKITYYIFIVYFIYLVFFSWVLCQGK